MSEPKRYTGKTEGTVLGSPHWEHPKGEWVKWDDYARLKAENTRLKTEVDHLMVFCNCTLIPNKELQAQVERLIKAGDNVCESPYLWETDPAVIEWRAAKEGKQS